MERGKKVTENGICCFTGHRNIDKDKLGRLSDVLEEAVSNLMEIGITTFRTGGARGFDTLAALKVLDESNINVDYLYAFMARTEKHAYVVLRVEDNAKAESILEDAGFHLITKEDICKI